MTAAIHNESNKLMSISWECLAAATGEDPAMSQLLNAVQEGFPDSKRVKDSGVSMYWMYRESLYMLDGVIMYKDRIIAQPSLRDQVLQILHSGHQGVSSMESRARIIVFCHE